MFTTAEKKIVSAALAREVEAIKRFIAKAQGNMKEAAEADLLATVKVAEKVSTTKPV